MRRRDVTPPALPDWAALVDVESGLVRLDAPAIDVADLDVEDDDDVGAVGERAAAFFEGHAPAAAREPAGEGAPAPAREGTGGGRRLRLVPDADAEDEEPEEVEEVVGPPRVSLFDDDDDDDD